jgi:hypothetical protein
VVPLASVPPLANTQPTGRAAAKHPVARTRWFPATPLEFNSTAQLVPSSTAAARQRAPTVQLARPVQLPARATVLLTLTRTQSVTTLVRPPPPLAAMSSIQPQIRSRWKPVLMASTSPVPLHAPIVTQTSPVRCTQAQPQVAHLAPTLPQVLTTATTPQRTRR